MRKTLFSTLLVLAMLLSMLGLDAGKVSAAATLSFSNVHLSSDGILTWDPISNPGTTCCWISFHTDKMTRTYDAGNGRCDLNKILIDNKFESGTYPVTLEQHDADSNKYEWKSSYTFVNPNPLTRMPQATNIRWEGDAIVWDYDDANDPNMKDPVFNVELCYMKNDRVESRSRARVCENRFYVGGSVTSGTNDYRFEIVTKASGDAYIDSDPARQYFYNITAEPQVLTGLKYEDGILTWDAIPNANEYTVTMYFTYEGMTWSEYDEPKTNCLDLAAHMKDRDCRLSIAVYAKKVGNRSTYCPLSKSAGLTIDYDFQGYALSVFGKRLDLNSNLNDVLGDGGSIKYIPTESKVIIDELTNEDLARIDGNVYDLSKPLLSTNGSLNLEGSAAVKLRGSFIDMGLDLVLAPNSSFRIISENTYAIKSRNIWFQGGAHTFKGKGPDILSAGHYITISEGTKKIEVISTTSERAVQCGYDNPDGKITIPDSMKIYIPENGRLSLNLKNIMTEDSHVASKVHISTTAPSPTPTVRPTATPTAAAKPTTKPASKPTATTAPVATAKPAGVTTATPAPTAVPAEKKSQILSFVERLYSCVLGREPEADGAAYWSDELYGFRRTGAEVAQGFIFSDEFVNRNTTDEQFVTILYNTFFNREPEESGMAFWLEQLSTGTLDRTSVANGFIYSQEWADTCASYGIRSGGDLKPSGTIAPTDLTYAFVERMYTTAMGRGYDEEGKQYWAGELANFNVTGEFVGAAFFLSDEMNSYGLSDKEFLGRLYATFMNREADADGESYWLSQMGAGVTRADIVFGFTRSPEFTEKCIEARIMPY